ncbi:hypothetical protein CKQ69_30585 [Bacillus toyonensis]|nr:hypothetical protein CKQ69_30585 [Bacillus toyonensis]
MESAFFIFRSYFVVPILPLYPPKIKHSSILLFLLPYTVKANSIKKLYIVRKISGLNLVKVFSSIHRINQFRGEEYEDKRHLELTQTKKVAE